MKPIKSTPNPTEAADRLDGLREFFSEAKYEEDIFEGLADKLNCNLTVFTLAIQRLTHPGWDPPNEEEAAELSLFWHHLKQNIRVMLEIHEMAKHTTAGRDYDPAEKGRYLYYASLDEKVVKWRKS